MAQDGNLNRLEVPILKHVEYSPSTDVIDPAPKGIQLDADGTIDYTAQDGTPCAGIAYVGGVTHRLSPLKITALATASKVWLCY